MQPAFKFNNGHRGDLYHQSGIQRNKIHTRAKTSGKMLPQTTFAEFHSQRELEIRGGKEQMELYLGTWSRRACRENVINFGIGFV